MKYALFTFLLLVSSKSFASQIPIGMICNMGNGIVEAYTFDLEKKHIKVNSRANGVAQPVQIYKFKRVNRNLGVHSLRANQVKQFTNFSSYSYLTFSFYPSSSPVDFTMEMAGVIDDELTMSFSEQFLRTDTECIRY